MVAKTCPSEQQLQAFQLGDLPAEGLDEVAAHLERCSKCESRAQQMDTKVDTLLSALRGLSDVKSREGATRYVGPRADTLPAQAGDAQVLTPTHIDVKSSSSPSSTSFPFLHPPVEKDEIGRLGNYRVLRLLGKGGMAFVFYAEDMALGRPVALKVKKPDLAFDAQCWQRFLREARIMAANKHEHLVTVYQAGQDGDAVFLAMELLQGETLDDWMNKVERADIAEVIRLGREIASGLAVVHANDLIHRDIKPANIWLEAPKQRVKLLDFGLARYAHDDTKLTHTGVIMGTPAFMSPEQARGNPVDHRTDLFSLGCILYSLATGVKPFRDDNTMAALTSLAVDTPDPVNEVNPDVPEELSDLIMRLLEKKPEDRPASADEVVRLFDRLRKDEHPTAVVRSAKVPGKRKSTGRYAMPIALGVGATLLTMLVVFACVHFFGPPPDRSRLQMGQPVGPPAPVAEVEGKVYLTDMKPSDRQGWPFEGYLPPSPDEDAPPRPPPPGEKGGQRPPKKDEPPGGSQGGRVRFQGKISPHGIFMHGNPPDNAPVSITYALDKKFNTFYTVVSLNDGPRDCPPMTFSVYGDGKLLWQSKPVSSQSDWQEKTLSVQGVSRLKIEVAFKDIMGAHAAWVEPYVAR